MQYKKPYKKPNKGPELTDEERAAMEVRRVRYPRGEEKIGFIEQMLGAGRMRVRCTDGVTYVGGVPGRLKRLFFRVGDFVLVEPWEYDKKKVDLTFRYTSYQVQHLRDRGMLGNLI